MQLVERPILARLLHSAFFSPAALSQATAGLVTVLNQEPFQKRDGNRVSMLVTADRLAIRLGRGLSSEKLEAA